MEAGCERGGTGVEGASSVRRLATMAGARQLWLAAVTAGRPWRTLDLKIWGKKPLWEVLTKSLARHLKVFLLRCRYSITWDLSIRRCWPARHGYDFTGLPGGHPKRLLGAFLTMTPGSPRPRLPRGLRATPPTDVFSCARDDIFIIAHLTRGHSLLSYRSTTPYTPQPSC